MDVYVDSDVVISSLLSRTGAAYHLLNYSTITLIISSISLTEIKKVISRRGMEQKQFEQLIQKRLKIVTIKQSVSALKVKYLSYVLDVNDAHIVAGAKAANVDFLLTYNLKHYKTTKLKADFNIHVLTPALFLQYLRGK